MLSKIDVHIDVQMFRISSPRLSSFRALAAGSKLRGIGEVNHYLCACGYGQPGGRKKFPPEKISDMCFLRNHPSQGRQVPQVPPLHQDRVGRVRGEGKKHRSLVIIFLRTTSLEIRFCFFVRPCMLEHMLGDHLKAPERGLVG